MGKMINCTKMVRQVIKAKNRDGDRITALLVEIVDQKYLKLRFRSGVEAYLAIDDIVFISPVKYQPLPSEMV
jgi:hypothetical protein